MFHFAHILKIISMTIVIHSESIRRLYTIHSICTRAFCLFIVYWIAVLAIPIAVVCISPIQLPQYLTHHAPKTVAVTGNNKVFVNDTSAQWTTTSTFGAGNVLVVNLLSGQGHVSTPAHIGVILEVAFDGVMHLFSFELDIVDPVLQNATAWLKCYQSTILPTDIAMPVWSSDGAAARSQFIRATASEPLRLDPVFETTYQASSTAGCSITANIQIPQLMFLEEARASDSFKVNLIFYGIVQVITWTLLYKVYSSMIRERLVFARRSDPLRCN